MSHDDAGGHSRFAWSLRRLTITEQQPARAVVQVSGPRDADDLDADLHDLLASAGIEAPLVLVGGSFGGFIVAYYAAKHPEDVAGVVMLDVPSPSATMTVEEVPEIAWDHPANPEHTDTVTEFENRFAAERLPIEAPLTVITATEGQSNVEDQAIWLEISPSATQVELEGGHGIAWDDPDGVAAEILKLVDAVG
jgi:pimeloyl-ACP methyl ester carboxylesterase